MGNTTAPMTLVSMRPLTGRQAHLDDDLHAVRKVRQALDVRRAENGLGVLL